ncbi:MAG: MATE family efflux transporter [Spirochaetes bacterium]|nr:MATE family efflux transporter [Spirochaetota bacterium]
MKILNSLTTGIKKRWFAEGGYREVLVIALPLIVSTGSWSLQHFIDRMFLTWYSPETIAAAMPAGILNFTLMSLFIGLAGYVNVFIAQYYGSGKRDMVGPVLWQSIYVSFIAGIFFLAVIPFTERIFLLVGHERAVMKNEIVFFRILSMAAFPAVASSAMSGFFSGLGRTSVIMWVNLLSTMVNIVLDYLLIFGNAGFPEMGMAGAGTATAMSAVFSFIAYSLLIFNAENNREYRVLSGWRPRTDLFFRLVKYGLPSGIHFFIDVAGFTFFIIFIGRLGMEYLAASNIAFNINTLSFMPMIGVGIAVSVLVGQNIGRNRPDLSEYCAYSGFQLAFLYLSFIGILYGAIPGVFLAPFSSNASYNDLGKIIETARVLLRFVAAYCVFDAMNIIFSSALKGAGDTSFVMKMISSISALVLIIPTFLVIFVFNLGIYAGWSFATAYVMVLGISFLIRFRSGRWKSMKVIEESNVCLPPCIPEAPAGRLDI